MSKEYFQTMLAFASAFASMGGEEEETKRKYKYREKVDIRKELSNMQDLFREYNLIKSKQSEKPYKTREAMKNRVESMEVIPYCQRRSFLEIKRCK